MQNNNLSYRRRVINLVRDAVVSYNRAVKLGDLQTYAESLGEACDRNLTITISRLVHGGELYVALQGRRDKYGGNFYLPTGIDPTGYVENLPPSWLDIVWQGFQELWTKRKAAAESESGLPEPLTTEEVEAHVLERFGKSVFPPEKTGVSYALTYLSKPKPEAVIKKLRRESFGRCLWVPASVSVEQYERSGSAKNKSETLNLMVRAAVEKYGRPVTADEIKKVAKDCTEFQSCGRMSFEYLINQTNFSLVKRVGLIEGKWYYYYGDISDDDRNAFVTLRHSALEWEQLNPSGDLDNMQFSKMTSTVFGRLMLIKQIARQITDELADVVNNTNVDRQYYNDATALTIKVKNVLFSVNEQLERVNIKDSGLPQEIIQQTNLLNSTELSGFLKQFLHKARRAGDAAKVADLTGRTVPRVLNPAYKSVFTGNLPVNETSRYLFDRFDVLIYVAFQLGGRLCRIMAMMAKSEMGKLRDGRFVLPMLKSGNYEQRLAATACLAFLQTPEYESKLFNTALGDIDAGVRQSALWAYAFLKGNRLEDLTIEIKRRETHPQVLKLVEQIEAMNQDNIWFI